MNAEVIPDPVETRLHAQDGLPDVDPNRIGPIGTGRGDGSRAVAIGGGHGLSRTLRALTHVVDHVTAVVTAADDGGSSGRLRREFGVVPPGDLRMALAALTPDPRLARLLQYRFTTGDGLVGHSLGNLITVALSDLNQGELIPALDELSGLLGIRGRVLPCTTDLVTLHGESDGTRIEGQVAVARTPRLERVWLEPVDPPASVDAIRAIERADLVVLGPGSLYTSVLANLLVKGIADAVHAAEVPVVYVANLREQLGETEGMGLVDHVEVLRDHAPGVRIDAIVGHAGAKPTGLGRPLDVDEAALLRLVGQVIVADLLDGNDGHAPAALAGCFDRILRS